MNSQAGHSPTALHNTPRIWLNIGSGPRGSGLRPRALVGDHCHLDGKERPYRFTTVEQLVEDFIAAVAARRAT